MLLLRDNHLRGFFKMVASRFVEVTDKEINCFKESENFFQNYTKTIIHLAYGE